MDRYLLHYSTTLSLAIATIAAPTWAMMVHLLIAKTHFDTCPKKLLASTRVARHTYGISSLGSRKDSY
jgi:hypothetical protein